ncbi:MAG: hypothetical protein ACHQAV_06205 [Solirubrobacterales bacterium]
MRASGTVTVASRRSGERPRLPTAVRSRVASSEIVACAVVLGLITIAMCAAHIRSGGFYYDDWSVLELGRFPPPGGLLHDLWLYYGQRPGQVLYYDTLDRALGLHASLRLALAAAMVLIEATCLYLLLRRLGLGARDGLAIAALSLTFPFSDSVWLWGILSLTSLAIAASLLGVILALRALESSGPRALALHTASLLLYAFGILSYEVFAVAGCLVGLLYVRAVGLRRARARWALDVVTIATTLALARAVLPIDIATPSRTQSLAGMVAHLGLIARSGARLAGASALPLGEVSPWIGAGLLAAVLAAAAALRGRLASSDALRAQLGGWLAVAGAGAVLAVAAWSVYVPAPAHYSPTAAGTVNRMNALAAIGIVIAVYSCLLLLVSMVGRLLRFPRAAVAPAAAALAVALGAAYLRQTAADARAWDAAAADQHRLLADLHAALPRLAPTTIVYAFDAPSTVGPGIPVLNTTLDLTSAIRIAYSSPKLVGVPVVRAASVACGRRGPLAGGVGGSYGSSYLVDVGARQAIRLSGREQCADQSEPPAVEKVASASARRAVGARPAQA